MIVTMLVVMYKLIGLFVMYLCENHRPHPSHEWHIMSSDLV
jgi:hypothetical protein